MDTGAAFVLGTGLLGLAGFLTYHAWQTRGEASRMTAAALARGWTFTKGTGAVVFDLRGRVDGVDFTAVSRRPAGMLGQNRGNAPTVTAIDIAAPQIDGMIVAQPVMPTTGGAAIANALAGSLFRKILLGDEADAVGNLVDVTASFAGAFPASHTVAASSPELALRVFGPETRKALSDLSARHGASRPIVLLRNSTRVTLRILDTIADPDEIEALARLTISAARSN